MIRSGEMRHIVEVLKLDSGERTEGGSGANKPTWREIARTYCRVRPIGSNQSVASDQVKRATSYEIQMRWLNGIDSTCRLQLQNFVPGGGLLLRIDGMHDPDGKRAELFITAVHIEKTGN